MSAWIEMFFDIHRAAPPLPNKIFIPAVQWDDAKTSWEEDAWKHEWARSPFNEDGTGKMNGIPIERYPRA